MPDKKKINIALNSLYQASRQAHLTERDHELLKTYAVFLAEILGLKNEQLSSEKND